VKLYSFLLLIYFLIFSAFQTQAFAETAPLRQLIAVFDVDDTLKQSSVKGQMGLFTDLKIKLSQKAFVGAPEIALAVARNAQIYYLSSGLEVVRSFYTDFLDLNRFPKGELILRLNLFESRVDFKIRMIQDMMETNPKADFIFFGDNGQNDPDVYRFFASSEKYSKRVKGRFIRTVYDANASGQVFSPAIAYFTDLELAIELERKGLISRSDLSKVRDIFELFFVQGREQELIPVFGQISKESIKHIAQVRSNIEDRGLQKTLGRLGELFSRAFIFGCSNIF
jgi:hypothetical protein